MPALPPAPPGTAPLSGSACGHPRRPTWWGLGLALLLLWLAACTLPSSTAGEPDPTAFIATRVVQLLTQNAHADAATRAAAVTPPAPKPTATAAPATPTAPAATAALPTAGFTLTPVLATPTPDAPADATVPPCADQACAAAAGHFWLERPIAADSVNYPDRTYPFGGTMGGQREPHHGVEFANPAGTPVIAAAPGQVVVAGNDHVSGYGPATDFYGNLVVVQLDQTYNGQPVFILYGHLKSISVQTGQHVTTGEELGLVGATGVAIGAHLHFEVRVGENTYAASRNPELWLKPLRYDGLYQGAVAGRVVDTEGRLVSGYPLVLRPMSVTADNPRSRYFNTYAADPLGLSGDDRLQENFATTDMPLGSYTISINTTKTYQQVITVTAGSLTWVQFTVAPPPPPTATPLP